MNKTGCGCAGALAGGVAGFAIPSWVYYSFLENSVGAWVAMTCLAASVLLGTTCAIAGARLVGLGGAWLDGDQGETEQSTNREQSSQVTPSRDVLRRVISWCFWLLLLSALCLLLNALGKDEPLGPLGR